MSRGDLSVMATDSSRKQIFHRFVAAVLERDLRPELDEVSMAAPEGIAVLGGESPSLAWIFEAISFANRVDPDRQTNSCSIVSISRHAR